MEGRLRASEASLLQKDKVLFSNTIPRNF